MYKNHLDIGRTKHPNIFSQTFRVNRSGAAALCLLASEQPIIATSPPVLHFAFSKVSSSSSLFPAHASRQNDRTSQSKAQTTSTFAQATKLTFCYR